MCIRDRDKTVSAPVKKKIVGKTTVAKAQNNTTISDNTTYIINLDDEYVLYKILNIEPEYIYVQKHENTGISSEKDKKTGITKLSLEYEPEPLMNDALKYKMGIPRIDKFTFKIKRSSSNKIRTYEFKTFDFSKNFEMEI